MIATVEDRSIAVPPGAIVRTGYVAIHQVVLACKDRMGLGDVNTAYQRRLQLGERQPWPCPRGQWIGERFSIEDGRHDYVAALMLGQEWILVAWLEAQSERVAPISALPIGTREGLMGAMVTHWRESPDRGQGEEPVKAVGGILAEEDGDARFR